MNKTLLCCFFFGCVAYGQSVVQAVNSGAVIGTASSVSVGEIVVVPQNTNQSASGLIGILAQNQALSVDQLDVADGITVYPNPTTSGIFFKSQKSLAGEPLSVVSLTGQEVWHSSLTNEGSVDLSALSPGVYVVRLESINKTFKIVKN
ncbi:MAG TPA: T9SS type A sorting domain-containing protein [Flavobacterium sp.]|nr:T9SS type A sorting domain-containing protein [Flavobacterium sp.]